MALKENKTKNELNMVSAQISICHKKNAYASFFQCAHLGFKLDSQKKDQKMNPSHPQKAYARVWMCTHFMKCIHTLRQIRILTCFQQNIRNRSIYIYILCTKQYIKALKKTLKKINNKGNKNRGGECGSWERWLKINLVLTIFYPSSLENFYI